jgi:thiol-disulfide isomerase/thioredoxin
MRGPLSQLVNQHSYVLIALAVFLVAIAVGLGFGRRVRVVLMGGVPLGFALAFAYLYVGAGDVRSPADLERALRSGRPVAVEFYSNYCMACLGAKPVWSDLERELAGRAAFLRVDFQSAAGQALADRYRIDTVPTFLAFGRDGRLLLQLEGDPGVPLSDLRRTLADAGPSADAGTIDQRGFAMP